ncbi:MAG: cyclic nucleotide-binding domain-containing protein [Chromatiales bacterium]|jgi:CRP/FNR family transcriptional regulator, cyclic AMP receptor protein|nr:cyclic nucleotide-binding domain-containing protein [Chromatiales bacterium]
MHVDKSAESQALDRFLALGHRCQYANGDVIISAGDHSSELFYLLEGSVSVQYEDTQGHEIILAYLHEGEFFGEIGMLGEDHERSAWVRSRHDSCVIHLPHDALQRMMTDSPELVFGLLAQLATRVRDTSRKASALAFTDVAGRVARALLDLGQQPEAEVRPDGVKISVTRHEIGRLAGCSREMVSRVIRVLDERRAIGLEGRSIVIFNQD